MVEYQTPLSPRTGRPIEGWELSQIFDQLRAAIAVCEEFDRGLHKPDDAMWRVKGALGLLVRA